VVEDPKLSILDVRDDLPFPQEEMPDFEAQLDGENSDKKPLKQGEDYI